MPKLVLDGTMRTAEDQNSSTLCQNATTPRLRFSARLGEEPEIEVGWPSG